MNEADSVKALALRMLQPFSSEDYDLARRTIVECCKATKRGRSRNAEGKIIYVEEPDYPVRLTAAVKIAEFVAGKPTTTSVVANVNAGTGTQKPDEFFTGMLQDRTAVEAMRDVFDKLVSAAERVQPVDIAATAADAEKHGS